MKAKSTIAVLAGGYSGEFEVSMNSAQTILDHIDRELFDPYLVNVGKGHWYVHDHGLELPVDLNTFSFTKEGQEVAFDYAYIIIHGTPGEDGKLQGYLDMMSIPYSTGSVLNTALTFNKARTQRLMLQEGVPIAKHLIFRQADRPADDRIVAELGLPFFVKPTESGSSIGVSMVRSIEALSSALELAFSIHEEVIIEAMLKGRELACGVYRSGSEVIALPITEISAAREFFDYEAKYNDKATLEITPADIPTENYAQCQQYAKRIYELTDCKGIARADFFLCDDGLYFVEINTVPGMSEASLVPQQIQEAGIDLKSMITGMILADLKND